MRRLHVLGLLTGQVGVEQAQGAQDQIPEALGAKASAGKGLQAMAWDAVLLEAPDSEHTWIAIAANITFRALIVYRL